MSRKRAFFLLSVSLALGIFFGSFAQKIQAIVYHSSSNVWCSSALNQDLNRPNSGFLATLADKTLLPDSIWVQNNLSCVGKTSVLGTNEWNLYKEIYKTTVNNGTSYTPVTVNKFWTRTPGTTNTQAYVIKNDGLTEEQTTNNNAIFALPIINLKLDACTKSGSGTVADPYILTTESCPASPKLELDRQVSADQALWNIMEVGAEQVSLELGGQIIASNRNTTYKVTFDLMDGEQKVKTYVLDNLVGIAGKETSFTIIIPIADFNASKENWAFLGPQKIEVMDKDSKLTTTISWRLSFSFPAFNIEHISNYNNYIRVYNALQPLPIAHDSNQVFATRMQEFTSAHCAAWPEVTGLDYSNVYGKFSENPGLIPFTLRDERDGKIYEIRKFADGNCWMVDNLAYGGGTDGYSDYCAAQITNTSWRWANSEINTTAVANNGLNPQDGSRNTLLGNCINYSHTNYCQNTAGGKCGYLYNWAAAIQDKRGREGLVFQPSEPTAGLCPSGWHLPTSNQFCTLDKMVYNKADCNDYTLNNNFYQLKSVDNPNGNFKGLYFPIANYATGAIHSETTAHYWSSSSLSASASARLGLLSSGLVSPYVESEKGYGFAIRCLKTP